MFYCEFSKNFNKSFFIEKIRVTASVVSKIINELKHFKL